MLQKSFFFSRIYFSEEKLSEEFQIEAFRFQNTFVILKLKGVDSIAQAEEVVGKDIFCPIEDFSPLKKGEFYFHQIEGSTVITKSGEQIGCVHDVMPVTDNDLLVVHGQGREYFIPLTQTICLEIDLEKRTIIIDPPEGLLDLDEI
ncbi:ribosome maturation factor RimM [Acidobacteriota bacterium]